MAITYRMCTTNEEFSDVHDIEILIWRVSPADAITSHMMHVIHHIGGCIVGAYDSDSMVGMAVGTPTQHTGMLWSHMAGVHPDYQGQGIGLAIKHFQRDWALKQGYTQMRWSFDPAMRRNAHFNFNLLGAVTSIYHANFYGIMTDGINAGVPSDRFEAIWDLDEPKSIDTTPDHLAFLLTSDNHQPIQHGKPTDAFHAVACPYDFPAIKAHSLDLAIQWRHTMRDTLQAAFYAGYQVVDFVTDPQNQSCYYVLHQKETAL